jgi:hypothetical protein
LGVAHGEQGVWADGLDPYSLFLKVSGVRPGDGVEHLVAAIAESCEAGVAAGAGFHR